MVEKVFKSEKLEKLKREIRKLVEEEVLVETIEHMKTIAKPASEEKKEQAGAFWEEELILSMLHKAQDGDRLLCIEFASYLTEEVSR